MGMRSTAAFDGTKTARTTAGDRWIPNALPKTMPVRPGAAPAFIARSQVIVIGSIQRSLCLFTALLALSLSSAPAARAGDANTGALRAGQAYDRFIVRFGKDTPERDDASARKHTLDAIGHEQGLGLGHVRRLAVGAELVRTDRKLDIAAARALMQRLARNPHVEFVEVDGLRTAVATANDTYYGLQWNLWEATAGIGLPAAWDRAGGNGVVVAVLDTGTTMHSDVSAQYRSGRDFISVAATARDGDGWDADPNDLGDWAAAGECGVGTPATNSSWHGTRVAGTIAAITTNAPGMAGVAPSARLLPGRVLGKCGGYDADIADAIVWAAGGTVTGVPANGYPAAVINLSFGGPGACPASVPDAINTAVGHGAVVVVAAGNDNTDAATTSPASCANVIVAGAVGRTGARASYSNYGGTVDLVAPGGDGNDSLVATSNSGTTSPVAENYVYTQGTSFAAPQVAGVVALMQGIKENTPAAVETLLETTARPLPLCPLVCGAGLVDAAAAVSAAAPALFVGDVTIREGNAGTQLATFTATLSRASDAPVGFTAYTSNGSAVAGSDYVALSAPYSIPAGQMSKTFTVTINGDTEVEPNQTFAVNLTGITGAIVGDAQGLCTIAEDDMTLSISDPTPVAEGDGGSQAVTFTLSLSQPSLLPVTFNVSTGTSAAAGMATSASGDFQAIPVTASSLAPGQTSKTFTVQVNGDTAVEANEIFGLNFTSVVGAQMPDYTGVATLLNDDGPTLSISDATLSEGNSGPKVFTFTVSLSAAQPTAVTYNIFTAADTGANPATAGTDYSNNSLVPETIPAGQLSKTFSVSVTGDATAEENETFQVRVGGATGATVFDGTGVGTILNDDGTTLSIADVTVTEGQTSASLPATRAATFTLALSQTVASTTTCTATTADGSALAGSDYAATTQTVSIPAGMLAKAFTVAIYPDNAVEGSETFVVDLACADSNLAPLAVARGGATIAND
jgi:serine protease